MKKRFVVGILLLLSIFMLPLSSLGVVFASPAEATLVTTHLTDFSETVSMTKFGNHYYLVSQTQHQLIKTNETETNVFSVHGGTVGSLNGPSLVASFTDGSIIVYDELNRFQIFSGDLVYQSFFNSIELTGGTTTYRALGAVSSIATDFFDHLFALDYTNNMILKKGISDNYLSVLLNCADASVNLSSVSRIAVTPNGEEVAVLVDSDTLLIVNEDGNQTVTLADNYTDLRYDCAEKLYLFQNGTDASKIERLSVTFSTEASLELTLSFTDIFLDTDSGNILYLTESGIYLLQSGDFTTSASNFAHPVDFNLAEKLQSSAVVGTVTSSTGLYVTPYSLIAQIMVPQNAKILILSSVVPQNQTLSYCMFEVGDELYLGYMKTADIEALSTQIVTTSYTTYYNNVLLYKYPTVNSPVVQTLSVETNLSVINSANDYIDAFGNTFYAVSTTNGIGYVKSNEVISTSLFESEPVTEPTPTDYQENEAVAFVLILASLGLLTAFVLYNILKKPKFEL